jgi:hypothetical protein
LIWNFSRFGFFFKQGANRLQERLAFWRTRHIFFWRHNLFEQNALHLRTKMLHQRRRFGGNTELEPLVHRADPFTLVYFERTSKQEQGKRTHSCTISHVRLARLHHFVIATVATVQALFGKGYSARVKVHLTLAMTLKGALSNLFGVSGRTRGLILARKRPRADNDIGIQPSAKDSLDQANIITIDILWRVLLMKAKSLGKESNFRKQSGKLFP